MNTNETTKVKGLVIRFSTISNGKYVLCDGKCPDGCTEEEGEIYIGNTVKWFDTWEEADEMRKMIDATYQ